jgi:hypothetical protein
MACYGSTFTMMFGAQGVSVNSCWMQDGVESPMGWLVLILLIN